MIKYLSKFLYVVGDRKSRLIQVILLFLLTSLLDTVGIGLIGPFITLATTPETIQANHWLHWFYTTLALKNSTQFVVFFGFIIIIIFCIKSFLSFYVQKYVFEFSYNQKGRLTKRLMKAYLAAPYTFHLNRNTSLLIQNILSETNNFCNGIMLPILNSVAYAVITLCLAALLIKTNLTASIFILVILLIPISLYLYYKGKLARWGKQASRAQVGIVKTINHGLGGLKETKILGCEGYFEKQMDEHVNNFEEALTSAQTFKLLPRILIESVLITFLVGLTSIFLISNQGIQNLTAVLGVFTVASIRLIPAITQLTNGIGSLRKFSYTLSQIYHDLKEVETLENDRKLKALNQSEQSSSTFKVHHDHLHFADKITLEHITYFYPEVDEPALTDICLTIKRGQAVGLIGKSGAGKTTLVDVILGLLFPEKGDIQVDDVSVYSNLRGWQNLIGYIPQSIFLMDDTIEKNIAFGVPEQLIDQEKLNKAIQMAQLTSLLEGLPDGLKTIVGERGVRLSGGQRQRIGIARALYHQREILVLDEATAALDNETERLVNDAIKSLGGLKTLIIIAHRLTTIEHCDRIYLMERGQIAKSGSYREVVLEE